MLFSHNENQRLEVLNQYQILDTPPEEVFDELAQLTANFCEAPIALISLVDGKREWFKSKIGVTISEVPRCSFFGSYTILQSQILIIPDTLQDERFATNPLVTSNQYFRFYAGVPLITSSGFALGSLCIIDFTPRNLSIKEQVALQQLAQQVIRHLELHRAKLIDDSQKNFNLFFSKNPNPMWVYNQNNLQFLDVNEAAVIHYGYSRKEFLQMRITDIRPPEDIPIFMDSLGQKPSNLDFAGQWQHRRKDGQIIDVEIFTNPIEYGSYNAQLVNIRDITEQKQIEKTLQESEARFRVISETISVPFIISRVSDGLILYANPELLQTFQFSLEDLVNHKNLLDLYHNLADLEALLKLLDHQGFIHNYELQLKRADGTYFWAIASLQYLNFNNESAILTVFYDIDDRKNAETQLQEQNELLHSQIIGIGQDITERKQTELALKAQAEREQLMRTVAQGIRQSLNLQDILNATVQEVRDLLGVDRVIVYQFDSEMIGTIRAESVEPGWTVSLNAQIHDKCFQAGAGVEYYQGRKRAIANIYEAGLTDCHIRLLEQFEVQANLVVPILLEVNSQNPGSHLWGLLIAHQCSDFREWEENQLDLLDHLTVQLAIAIQQASILEQAQAELVQRQKAQVKLKAALAEKEVLLKEVHHRVKNNLQIVSSLLQLQSQTLKDPEAIKVLRESQNRIESISLIHKNLYTSANIGQIDVAAYIQNLATSLLISYQLCPEKISLETDINPLRLNVDQAIACGLVINELISNALKHAFPNQQEGIISIILHNSGNRIELIIQDNGIGLPDNLDWRNTDSLGLSLVHDLVTEQLEGNITLERNHGTIFKIEFTQLTLH
ncbi:PAS domain S-box protein [Nostoc flagelliforme FACHB-838]|uniref:PAS domain S-box protein n=1 Tax=Nostoc flagelliforme FACHB-838 TaxID=2692904 RepID=A0ABR8DL34_9NOSO|nr:GAF domain-containing protein [Nostoc flagelliforme]MBD2530151.1 PAS domain S-box protein [Nostoc flagelliforme FACHB-838]